MLTVFVKLLLTYLHVFRCRVTVFCSRVKYIVRTKKLGKFRRFWGLGVGVQKVSTFTAKGTSLRESTSFKTLFLKHKIGWGCDLQR